MTFFNFLFAIPLKVTRQVILTFQMNWKLCIHWMIKIILAIQCIYAGWMVFQIKDNQNDVNAPLIFVQNWVNDMSIETIFKRRLYAYEFWICFIGLILYLSQTDLKSLFESKSAEKRKKT